MRKSLKVVPVVSCTAVIGIGPLLGTLVSPPVQAASVPTNVISEFATAVEGTAAVDGVDVSTELAGTVAGVAELTPAGWALDAGVLLAAGGQLVWQNRKAILSGINAVWDTLSASQQSALEAAKPGQSVSLPNSAIDKYLQGLQVPVAASAGQITVPSTLKQGQPLELWMAFASSVSNNAGAAIWAPGSGWTILQNNWNAPSGQIFSVPAAGHGTSDSWVVNGSAFFYGASNAQVWQVEIGGLKAGERVNYQAFYGTAWPNWEGSFKGSVSSAGVPEIPSNATLANGDVSVYTSEVPVVTSVPSVSVPAPSTSNPTHWEGGAVGSALVPVGQTTSSSSTSSKGVNVTVNVGFAAFEHWILQMVQGPVHWLTVTVPNWILGLVKTVEAFLKGLVVGFEKWVIGVASGVSHWVGVNVPNWVEARLNGLEEFMHAQLVAFETWVGYEVVPTSAELTNEIQPLKVAIGTHVPFAYVQGIATLLPAFAQSVNGSCFTLPLPEFGFNGQPANVGTQTVQFCQSGSWGSSVLSGIRTFFGYMLWAFFIGWNILLFRRLLRE